MKPSDFFEHVINEMEPGGGVVTLSPGPMQLKIGEHDRAAMEIVLMLISDYPWLKVGDTLKILDAARWWAMFWAAMPDEDDLPGESPNWNPAADLLARDGERINDPR